MLVGIGPTTWDQPRHGDQRRWDRLGKTRERHAAKPTTNYL